MQKVSIIVPIYNAAKYLSETIESVLNQTYTNFELLLINDNSTDNSKEICEKYAQKDNRIVLLNNNSENHGPGPTRNIGLDNAKGEFIYFIDADDWIDESLLQCAVFRLLETNADMVQIGAIYEQNNPKEYYWKGKDVLTRAEMKKYCLKFWSDNLTSLWLQFFRRETVKGIRFENIINGEDSSYVMDAFCNSEKIAFIPKTMYHYRYVESSTSHSWNKDTIMCRAEIWQHQKKCLEALGVMTDESIYSGLAYINYVWSIYQLSKDICPLSYKEKKQMLLSLNEKMEFDKYRKYCPLKQQHGIDKVKYILVKFRLEKLLLLLGPLFLRIVRGE